MLHASSSARQRAHLLIDRLEEIQVSAVVQLIEALIPAAEHFPVREPFGDDPVAEIDRRQATGSPVPSASQAGTELVMQADDTDFWTARRKSPFRAQL